MMKGVLGALSGLVLIGGCSTIAEIHGQLDALGKTATISGSASVADGIDGQPYAVLIRDDGEFYTWLSEHRVADSGSFEFHVEPGSYLVGAYADTNQDETYNAVEPATYVGLEVDAPQPIKVGSRAEVTLDPLHIERALPQRNYKSVVRDVSKLFDNIGRIVDLNDPMLFNENGSLGLWRPYDFLDSVGGGLLLLEPFTAEKRPVVFVHGINGTPLVWREILENLDRSRVQPVLLYYPSGIDLDIVSDFFVTAMNQLGDRHGFSEFAVVAHSMGGLVAHSFVRKYVGRGGGASISSFMTINTPMLGLASADLGVRYAPVFPTSWRDVAYRSEFILDLLDRPLPKGVPYHLVFSYQDGEDGDGLVPMGSQIPRRVQMDAATIRGYDSGHADILTDMTFINDFNTWLAEGGY